MNDLFGDPLNQILETIFLDSLPLKLPQKLGLGGLRKNHSFTTPSEDQWLIPELGVSSFYYDKYTRRNLSLHKVGPYSENCLDRPANQHSN